jgi:hypothetical protein
MWDRDFVTPAVAAQRRREGSSFKRQLNVAWHSN